VKTFSVRYVVYLEDVGLHLTNLCASLLTEPSEHDGCLCGKMNGKLV